MTSETAPGSEPIEIVIPFPAGSAFDNAARGFCDVFADAAGADAVGAALTYANVLGGEGTAGAFAVKNAAPDGRSFLVGNKGAITSYPHTDPESYQPGDFAALGQFAEAPIAIAVGAGSAYQTLADLLDAAREKPGSVAFATPHPQHTQHLAITEFAERQGLRFAFVTTEGGNPGAIAKVVEGAIDFAFLGAHNYVEPARSGAIRILGVAAARRVSFLADAPTCREQGFDLVTAIWLGLLCRADTSPDRLEQLRQAFDRAAGPSSGAAAAIERFDLVAAFLDHAAFQRRITDDFEFHGRVLRMSPAAP